MDDNHHLFGLYFLPLLMHMFGRLQMGVGFSLLQSAFTKAKARDDHMACILVIRSPSSKFFPILLVLHLALSRNNTFFDINSFDRAMVHKHAGTVSH